MVVKGISKDLFVQFVGDGYLLDKARLGLVNFT